MAIVIAAIHGMLRSWLWSQFCKELLERCETKLNTTATVTQVTAGFIIHTAIPRIVKRSVFLRLLTANLVPVLKCPLSCELPLEATATPTGTPTECLR